MVDAVLFHLGQELFDNGHGVTPKDWVGWVLLGYAELKDETEEGRSPGMVLQNQLRGSSVIRQRKP